MRVIAKSLINIFIYSALSFIIFICIIHFKVREKEEMIVRKTHPDFTGNRRLFRTAEKFTAWNYMRNIPVVACVLLRLRMAMNEKWYKK